LEIYFIKSVLFHILKFPKIYEKNIPKIYIDHVVHAHKYTQINIYQSKIQLVYHILIYHPPNYNNKNEVGKDFIFHSNSFFFLKCI